tara:strand:- start:1672 stop:1776 length:105 start_codon:yes stop_codon:yes gene_type:complete
MGTESNDEIRTHAGNVSPHTHYNKRGHKLKGKTR